MLDKTHTYTKPGNYKIKISNVKDFRSVVDISELGLNPENISCAEEEARHALFFETINHIVDFHPELDLDDFTDFYNERYEEVYRQRALETYVFNKFDNTPITNVKPSYNTTTIGNSAYSNLIQLIEFDFNNIENICDFAFFNCYALGLDLKLASYGQYSLKFSNKLKTIGNMAFFNCNSLHSISIPKSVTSIGYQAFGNCKNLRLIVFEDRTAQDVIYDFPDLFVLENGEVKNRITTTNGYIVFGADATTENLNDLIAELDEAYPLYTSNELNISENSPYDDEEPCPFATKKESNINISNMFDDKERDQAFNLLLNILSSWKCPTGSCDIGKIDYDHNTHEYYAEEVKVCLDTGQLLTPTALIKPGNTRRTFVRVCDWKAELERIRKEIDEKRDREEAKRLIEELEKALVVSLVTVRTESAVMPRSFYDNTEGMYKDLVNSAV